MTPAERTLLLAVAKYIHPYVVKKFSGLAARSLDERIAAVEVEVRREEMEEFAACSNCVEYEKVHDHECGRDDRLRGSDDLCGEWSPNTEINASIKRISSMMPDAEMMRDAGLLIEKNRPCLYCGGSGEVEKMVDCPECQPTRSLLDFCEKQLAEARAALRYADSLGIYWLSEHKEAIAALLRE